MAELSDAAKEAYASCDTQVIYTLELRHPGFTAPIRVVRDRQNLLSTLEDDAPLNAGQEVEFIALGFDLKLPEANKNKLPELAIEIDNIYLEEEGRRISDYVDDTLGSLDQIELTCRAYTPDIATPIDQPYHLILHEVSADKYKVSAKAKFFNAQNETFPRNTYTIEEFPTLQYN